VPEEADPLAFGVAWGYDCALDTAPAGLTARRIRDGAERTIDPRTPDWIRALGNWASGSDRSRNED